MDTKRKQCSTIDEYIASFPEEVQKILQKLRQEIKQIAPHSEETINYGIPTFKVNGKNVVHFAAFKKHIGFYPTPSGINAFQDELSGYKQAKGSVQFPLDAPIPYGVIKRIVEYQIQKLQI